MLNLIDVGSTELKIAFLSTGDSIVFKIRKVLRHREIFEVKPLRQIEDHQGTGWREIQLA